MKEERNLERKKTKKDKKKKKKKKEHIFLEKYFFWFKFIVSAFARVRVFVCV